MNLIQRFKGIFTNPDETFGEIKESPDFKGLLVSFLIVLLECVMIAAILMSKITITDHPQFSYILFIVILITLIIGFLLVYVVDTIIIWIIGKIFKGSGSLKQTASAFGYVCIFQVIYYVGVLISALSFHPVSIKISNAILYQQIFTMLFGSLIMLIFSIVLAILFTIYVYFISRYIHELNKIRAIIIVMIFIIISLVFEIF